ncbi:MAG: gliding motility-associated C-terminal domain-containing protein, partial [Bacteroidota bacterium]
GENDEFQLYPSPSIQSIDYIRIFNRWGALVFESNDINASWDGTFNGELAPAGVYVYIMEAPCPTIDGKLMKSGDITILR